MEKLPKQRATPKRPRGRPKSNGGRPQDAFRTAIVLSAYDRSKVAGEKHVSAIQVAIESVHEWFPHMLICATEVRKIVAKYRNRDQGDVLLFEETSVDQEQIMPSSCNDQLVIDFIEKCDWWESRFGYPLPPFTATARRVLSFNLGNRPIYVRSNAKSVAQSECDSRSHG